MLAELLKIIINSLRNEKHLHSIPIKHLGGIYHSQQNMFAIYAKIANNSVLLFR